jgi:hypothetical protein
MMSGLMGRKSRRITDQGWNIDLDEVEIMQVNAPSPDSYAQLATADDENKKKKKKGMRSWHPKQCDGVPRTMMKPIRYGRGKVRLNESSSGSTAGSPSIL